MDQGIKRRNRVARACNFCRRRKIKCDGNSPCSHCVSSNSSDCRYSLDFKKKNFEVNSSNSQPARKNISKMDNIETRLGRLEVLLSSLAEKIDGSKSSSYDEKTDDPASDSDTSSVNESQAIPTSPVKKDNAYSHTFEHYFGTQSTFHLFSNKSREWMKTKLGKENEDLLQPMEDLLHVCSASMEPVQDIFSDPQVELDETARIYGSVPFDRKLIPELLIIYENVFLATALCTPDELKSMLKHFHALQSKTSKSRKRMRYSELLTINICLAFCLTAAHESKDNDETDLLNPKTPILNSLSREEISKLEGKAIRNGIYYYNKIHVISEGILSVQGILMLTIYLETYWGFPPVNYILVTVAIRFAQEIGLHRYESLIDLPESAASFRRRMWWFCEFFDTEICYREGKPPLINDVDVSTLRENDEAVSEMMNMPLDDGCHYANAGKMLVPLNRLRRRAYNELFSLSLNEFRFDNIAALIRDLNRDLFAFLDSFDPKIRPRFYNDPEFERFVEGFLSKNFNGLSEMLLITVFQFFVHLMTINRLPFQAQFPDHDENSIDSVVFRNLELDSARTVMLVSLSLDPTKISSSCKRWVVYYPYVGYLILLGNCLNRPNSPDIEEDVKALVHICSRIFFKMKGKDTKPEVNGDIFPSFSSKQVVFFISIITLLEVLMKILERESSFSSSQEFKQLNGTVETLKTGVPKIRLNPKRSHGINHLLNFFEPKGVSKSGSNTDLSPVTIDSLKAGINDHIDATTAALSGGQDLENIVGVGGPGMKPNGSPFLSTFSEAPSSAGSDVMFNDDNMFISQVYNLPNFFYDNNLGT